MAMKDAIDALLSGAVANGDVPGVVAGVTTREGPIYEQGFGERTIGSGVAMSADAVGWIASMTKPLTAAAAMQLVERGKLDLDAPAEEVVPHLGQVEVLTGFDGDGKPLTRPPARPVTLRHLLTHTAGFSYEIWNADIVRYLEVMDLPGVTTCQNAALLTPLTFDPGDDWDYGINIDWAGKMVEVASGQKLGDFLRENLFAPLGMTDTAFKITPAMEARRASIHARTPDGFSDTGLVIEQEPEFQMGGGGLYSTVADYMRFVRMILNHGEADGHQVLKPETVATMSVNQMGANRVKMLTSVMPPFSNDAEFFPGLEKTWGLSFMINETDAPTGRPAGSLAWAGLANSYFWIDPKNGIGGVYLTQIIPFVDVKSLPLNLEFESTVYRNL